MRNAWIGVLVGLVLFVVQFFYWDFLVDDAFITFRHVANFWAGEGLTYNPDVRVEGYSNPLWTLLLVGLTATGMTVQTAAKVLGLLCGVATLPLFAWFTSTRLGWPTVVTIITTLLLSAFSPWIFWAQAGLEGSLHALLLFGTVVVGHDVLQEDSSRRSTLALGCLLGALSVSRTEAVILGPAVIGLMAMLRPKRVKQFAVALVPWATLTAGHLVARRIYYGAWIAAPAVAKTSTTWTTVSAGAEYLRRNFLREDLWLVAFVAIVGTVRARRSFAASVSLALVVGYCGMFMLVGGDPLYKFRPIAMTAPLLFVLVGRGVAPHP